MDIEFHYYMTYMIAQRAGFTGTQSHIVAYSSQYVDDNDDEYIVNQGEPDEYRSSISQTMNILRPKIELIGIYPCFHFIPGEYEHKSARRKDGKMHLLNTTPNSKLARSIFRRALKSNNLYRIGVATHAYADTWAHQSFVGYYDYFNALKGAVDRLSPNVGHADAAHDPDIPGLVWKDERLLARHSVVDNRKRFLEAARHIFASYCRYRSPDRSKDQVAAEWLKLEADLAKAMGDVFEGRDRGKNRKKRIGRYRRLINAFEEYDEDAWFKEAIKRHVRGIPDNWHHNVLNGARIATDKYTKKPGFADSHWVRFQEAVKAHRRDVEASYSDQIRECVGCGQQVGP